MRVVKWLVVIICALAQISCTTLANRRDLYSPAPDSMSPRTTTTTITTTTRKAGSVDETPPDFR